MSSNKPEAGFNPPALAAALFGFPALPPNPRFVVALSGGVDSSALLHALCALRGQRAFSVIAVHIDHGLQAAAATFARHCTDLCQQLQVPLEVRRVAVSPQDARGLEGAARDARYAALAACVQSPRDVLLTAHHADDQAETLLLQVLRGAGVHGLAGVRGWQPFAGGALARPLLGFTRVELAAYLRAHAITAVDDPMNADPRWARGFVRAEVMPRLQRRWPQANRALARAAANAEEAASLLDTIALDDLTLVRRPGGALAIAALCNFPAPRRRNLLRYWLASLNLKRPSQHQLAQLEEWLAHTPATRQAVLRWPGTELRRYRDALFAMAPLPPVPREWRAPWREPQSPLALPGLGITVELVTGAGGLDPQWLTRGQWELRLRQGGERCRLVGERHRRALKDLLQARGVPPWLRPRLPLLYIDGALAALGAGWTCAEFARDRAVPGFQLAVAPLTSVRAADLSDS